MRAGLGRFRPLQVCLDSSTQAKPNVRSSATIENDPRWYIDLNADFPWWPTPATIPSIRADVSALGLNMNSTNMHAEIVSNKWVVGEAVAVLNNVGRRLVGYYHQKKIGPLGAADNRAKLGNGLDQTFLAYPGYPSEIPGGGTWRAEEGVIYFKRGHMLSGSQSRLYFGQAGFSQTDSEATSSLFNQWHRHTTNRCTFENWFGQLPVVTINNN